MAHVQGLNIVQSGKGVPPKKAAFVVTNITKPASGENVPLQVKITPEMRREFKSYAASHDLTISDLFAKAWARYKEQNP